MRALLVAGVLGVGTAIVFGAAALTATLFPNGTLVGSGWNGGMWAKDGWGVPVPAPMPQVLEVAPNMIEPPAIDSGVTVDGFKALPGDTVDGNALPAVELTPAPVP